ncbi:probable RNA-directed DNA polymerase from transposon X-element [Trichonephila clavipes]|nr:probable RNA-directed DNA polymerase from transposon X-element [Trichonephila clavipes]
MFLVQETWLEPVIDLQIANYRLTKDDRIEFPHTVTRGGTAIYCKNEIVHHRVPLPNLQGMDATAVQIKINNFPPINIVSAYVRRRVGHSFPVEDFMKIFNSGSNCIIAGDYNAAHVSWHNAKSTRFGQGLHKLIRDLRGAKLVAPQTATHLQPRQRFGSVIDLAVFKHIPFNHSVRVINDLSSDHCPVILELNLITSIIKNPEQLSTNWFNFKFALKKKPLPTVELTSNDNIELRKFWQRTRCPGIYSEFRTLSREIAKDIQAYSRDQWEKHIEALSPVDNTLWRKSSLLRKPFQSIPPLKGALGSIAITPIEKSEVIADSLQEQFEPNHVVGRELFDQRIHDEVTNFINTPHAFKKLNPPLQRKSYLTYRDSSPGNPPDLIRFLIPDKDSALPTNYRLISLLSCLSKVYEFVLLQRLNQHCAAANFIIPQQCGFRPKCSTVHQLLRVTELIHSGFAKHEATDRSFRVRVDKTLSSPRPIRSGLPQGSLNSPLLFTLYVNDMPQTDLSHLAMFADDTAIITQNKRFSVVISNLQHYISLLELWLTDWKVKVNASKSACLMFTSRPRLPVGLSPVQIFGQPVPWVRVAKYLGLFLDAKLTFAHHIEQTRKKAQAVHAVLKRLISRRSKLAIRHKVLLYKSIIRPVMSYGSQIWGSAGMCHLKKLHTLTNSFLRQIVNAPWFVRNEVIYRDLKIKPFLPHIKDLSKRFFDKLPSVLNELISNQPAYDPAVPSSQKRPGALLDHEFINFPQAKRLRVQI